MTSADPTTRSNEQERTANLPMPGWSNLTAPYWQHAARGELVIQRCDNCGIHRWEPVEVCYRCHSTAWHWDPVSGSGIVYSYTWAEFPTTPNAAAPQPQCDRAGRDRGRAGPAPLVGGGSGPRLHSGAASGSLCRSIPSTTRWPCRTSGRRSAAFVVRARLRSVQREGEQAWTSCRATTSCPPRHRVDGAAGACSERRTMSACSISSRPSGWSTQPG